MSTTICLGGLIAAGKTTFLKKITERCNQRGINLHVMGELYCDAVRDMVLSNLMVGDIFLFSHRLQMAFDAPFIAKQCDLLFMERSFIDHLAFYEAFRKHEIISEEHFAWSQRLVKELQPPKTDRFIFLEVSPEIAFQRKQSRRRGGDHIFTIAFMHSLHDAYHRVMKQYYPSPKILNWEHFGADLSTDSFIDEMMSR